jgi:hypothetical protein
VRHCEEESLVNYGMDALIPMLMIGLPMFVISMLLDNSRLRKVKARRGAYRL